MDQPKVSVIIPFYNLGEFLDDAVNSVLKQTYENFEVIIVNDGSPDESSVEKFKTYLNHKDPRVKTLDQKNQGLPATRNNGIKICEGKYICCLDADDTYHPEFIEKCVKVLESNEKLGFVTSWLAPFGDIKGENTIVQVPKDSNLLLIRNVPHVASMFTKAAWEKVEGYDVKGAYAYEDWNYWLSLLEAGYDWDVINEPLFNYRVRSNSMLRSLRDKDAVNYEYIINKHIKLFERMNLIDVLKTARNTIFEYDLIISQLNKENSALKDQLNSKPNILKKIKSKLNL